jgi:hypothetical protein
MHSSSVCALISGIRGTSLFREEGQLIFPARHSPLDLNSLVRMVAGSMPPRYYALMSRYMHTKPTTPFLPKLPQPYSKMTLNPLILPVW